MQQNEIRISETETEYLLFIPYNQKERARSINGRIWDPERKCWVYPRNISMYKALREEFAADLTSSSSLTPPQSFDEQETQKEEERNSELQKEFHHLRQTLLEINATGETALLGEMLSTKEKEIRLLQTESRNKDRENDELKRRIDQLEEKILTTEGEIKSLKAAIHSKDSENDELRQQADQLQDINTHPGIRNIAVEATGDDPAFGEHFRTLPIDENHPEILIETLRNWLKNCLKTGPKDFKELPELIQEHTDFDKSDNDLAHVIRTQRNLVVFQKEDIDERTIMGRALCCFFAAALLSPKLPEPKQPAFK